VARQAQCVFDTFGKVPGTVPSAFITNYVQARHLDPGFYDRFFKPGAYLRTHAEHMQRWARRAGGENDRWASMYARGTLDMWVERQGTGPDVLLIAGLGDPAEAWQLQLDGLADRYRLTAYDNRGMGCTPLPAEPFSVATMADDAAALLRALDVPATHVAGFSGGSVIAQELALRHPGLVRSLVLASTWARADAYFRAAVKFWRWLPEAAPSERAFPHQPSAEAIQRSIDAFLGHDTVSRLSQIAVPALVLAGGLDMITPRATAASSPMPSLVPGSRSWLKKRTNPSKRSPTYSTPRLTHSGGRSRQEGYKWNTCRAPCLSPLTRMRA
jgi:pimeloyl-ACP methyl ester carboxylesterase